MVLNALDWKMLLEKSILPRVTFIAGVRKARQLNLWLCFSVCVWRNDFTGLDLTFLSYNMWRLIITKCYENLKWMITMKVQRTARHFAILPFCYICAHLDFWNLCSNLKRKFSSFIEETSSAYFILLWWIITGCGSQLWVSFSFGVWKPVFNIISLLFLVVSLPLCQLHRRLTKAFSKIKHLPHWQLFWIFTCQTLHIQTT